MESGFDAAPFRVRLCTALPPDTNQPPADNWVAVIPLLSGRRENAWKVNLIVARGVLHSGGNMGYDGRVASLAAEGGRHGRCQPLYPGLEAQGERLLVDAARVGDEGAIAELYNKYFPRVYRYMLVRTGNVGDAEDLTEEVFIRVLDALERFEWRQVPFSAWLFRIAHNAIVSHQRRDGARGRLSPLSPSLPVNTQGPEEAVEARLALDEVMEATRNLPEAQRKVIALRFGAGLSVAETARALGKSGGNVKVIQHKAIVKLRELLVEKRPEDHEEKV
jgi:RNA polymerase sigma-70 factor (ECF subfamily)